MRLQAAISVALAILRVSAFGNPITKEDVAIAEGYMDRCLDNANFTCAYGALMAVQMAHLHSWQPVMDEFGRIPLQARGVVEPPKPEIDLHSIDSRCNPANMSEVQRFNGKQWIHHFTCMYSNLCKDVNGIGACQVAPGIYVFKAANDTTILDPIDQAPLLTEKKCNPENYSEALAWDGTNWKVDGVCLPPYACYDFASNSKFVFCAAPEDIYTQSQKIARRNWTPSMYGYQPPSTKSSHGSCEETDENDFWKALGLLVGCIVIVFLCMLAGAYYA
jgi:hypothetical protein